MPELNFSESHATAPGTMQQIANLRHQILGSDNIEYLRWLLQSVNFPGGKATTELLADGEFLALYDRSLTALNRRGSIRELSERVSEQARKQAKKLASTEGILMPSHIKHTWNVLDALEKEMRHIEESGRHSDACENILLAGISRLKEDHFGKMPEYQNLSPSELETLVRSELEKRLAVIDHFACENRLWGGATVKTIRPWIGKDWILTTAESARERVQIVSSEGRALPNTELWLDAPKELPHDFKHWSGLKEITPVPCINGYLATTNEWRIVYLRSDGRQRWLYYKKPLSVSEKTVSDMDFEWRELYHFFLSQEHAYTLSNRTYSFLEPDGECTWITAEFPGTSRRKSADLIRILMNEKGEPVGSVLIPSVRKEPLGGHPKHLFNIRGTVQALTAGAVDTSMIHLYLMETLRDKKEA